MNAQITFRTIEKHLRVVQDDRNPTEMLEKWYESVRDKPISEFDIEDVCRACRQQLYSEYILPVAVELLRRNVLAGEKYDGELLVALNSIPCDYWVSHLDLAWDVASIVSSMDTRTHLDLADDIRQLLASLNKEMG